MHIVTRIAIPFTIIFALVDPGYAQGFNIGNNCGLEQFQCLSGECIAGELLCDGKADCRDQSDETEIECMRPEILCPDYAFRCKYGACVNGDAVCNGIQDCVDNSDEIQSQCAISSGNQMERPLPCKKDEFTCDDGQCIYNISVCDGKVDCADSSDEVSAKCGSLSCAPIFFRCAYGACIDGDLRCNGVVNCPDGSDEDPKVCGSLWQTPFSTAKPTPVYTTSSTTTRIPTPTTDFCERPPQPPNGRWKLHPSQCANRENCDVPSGTTELPLGSHLVYLCNAGYKIEGNTDVFCGFGGNWHIVPVCIASQPTTTNSCELPPQPPNGHWELHSSHCANRENCDVSPGTTGLPLGSHLVYSCNAGYKIRGTTDVICSFRRNWLTIPDCIANQSTTTNSCELPPQPPNGHWKLHSSHCANRENCDVPPGTTELPLGSRLVYSCNAGYKIRGTTDVICSFRRNWLTIPDCIAIPTPTTDSCERPPQPPNGRWKLHLSQCANRENCDVPPGTTKLSLGSHLVYFCNAGYKIEGSTDVFCGFGGNWHIVPVCIETRCKGLSTASVSAACRYNAERISCETPVLPGTTANLRCQSSYRPEINRPLNQGNNVICNANGLWEPEPLRCIPGPLTINIYLNDNQLILQATLERNNATFVKILDDRVIMHTNAQDPNNPQINVRIPKMNDELNS